MSPVIPVTASEPDDRKLTRPATIDLAPEDGWRTIATGPVSVHLFGHLFSPGETEAAAAITAAGGDTERTKVALTRLDGHFALMAEGAGWVLAAVDRVRSSPLMFVPAGAPPLVGPRSPRLVARTGIETSGDAIDRNGAVALAMSGYTIGGDTLYQDLRQLRPGEAVLFRTGKAPQLLRYHLYTPWRTTEADGDSLSRDLHDLTLSILDKHRQSVGGRTIALPLSAGMDSRLIASGLAALGHRDVRCFSYGLPGNHEAEAARRIARRLGYPWTFVPLSVARQRAYFRSNAFRAFLQYADCCASTPFPQDQLAIATLKNSGWLPADAVIVNGNSGDFISGGHIPAGLGGPSPDAAAQVLDAHITKHYRLWHVLDRTDTRAALEARLREEWRAAGIADTTDAAPHGLAEFLEFQDRQVKFVISGQRTYEHFGLDWRLPLWDTQYLDFWERVPAAAKRGQRLYRDMLTAADWGGVWRDWPVNAKTIRPRWIVPLRLAAKAVHAPLGRDRWHRFERRWFQYWMELTCNPAIVPYSAYVRDRRGHLHSISWHTQAYLADKGLAFDGTPVRQGPSML